MAFDIKEIPLQFLSWGTPGIQNKILLEQDPRVPFFTTYTSIYDSEYISALSGGSILTFGKSLNISGDIFRNGSKLPSLNEIHNGILSDFYFSKTDFYAGCLDGFYPRIQGGIYDFSIKKADPEIRLIETRGDEYTRITRTNTSNAATRYNRVMQAGSPDSNTKLLLHFAGTDGSTTFTDSSANAHTVTANGNAQIDTALSKFSGFGSGLLDGTGDYLSIPSHTDFDFGTGDFTISFWAYCTAANKPSAGNYQCLYDRTDAASNGWWIQTKDTGAIICGKSGSIYVTGTTDIYNSTWNHIAFVRTSGTLKLFVNGTQEGGDVALAGNFDISRIVYLGYLQVTGARFFNGSLAEYRVSNTARWTSNFTVPSSAYAQSSMVEAQVWKAEDGVSSGEKGIITFGNTEQGNVYNAATHKFKIDGTEKARLTSTVLSLGTGISCASIGTSVMSINNTTAPTTNSVGGCLWTSSGVLFYKGSAGTITSLGGA